MSARRAVGLGGTIRCLSLGDLRARKAWLSEASNGRLGCQGLPDRGLWWTAISLLVGLGGYMGLATRLWGLAMGSALVAVALLLNHKRLADLGIRNAMFISLLLAQASGLALALLHFCDGPGHPRLAKGLGLPCSRSRLNRSRTVSDMGGYRCGMLIWEDQQTRWSSTRTG